MSDEVNDYLVIAFFFSIKTNFGVANGSVKKSVNHFALCVVKLHS